MQFSGSLHEIAKEYMNNSLKRDYICAHLRRRDFLYGHPSDVPSIKEAAKQIAEKLTLLDSVKTVYIATDASKKGNWFFLKIIIFLDLCNQWRTFNFGGGGYYKHRFISECFQGQTNN